jgi:ABC-type uncharacterized transport system auxiliary subunit
MTMRPPKRPLVIIALTGLLALLSGCSALNRPYPAKRSFALETPQHPERADAPAGATVSVRQFRVSTPYHQPQFVYRLGETEFKRDYYNEFIAAPSELVTGQTIAWLEGSGVFRTTFAGSSAADHDLLLEAVVTSLYGDYVDRDAPHAVLSIHFFLLADGGTHTDVVFDRSYTEQVSVDGLAPDHLVRGWSVGLQRILTSLETDLRTAPTVNVAMARLATERSH